MRSLSKLLAAAALVGLPIFAGSAHATPFGAAASGFTFLPTRPSLTLNATSGSLSLGDNTTLTGVSGVLAGTTAGTASGALTFSNTVGTRITESVASLFTFVDPAGGSFVFDVASVETTAYSYDPVNGTTLSLYVLGTSSGGHADLSATPASVIFNLSKVIQTTTSATFSNPPAPDPFAPPTPPPTPSPIPEPASIALLVSGLLGAAAVRRRSAG